MSSSHSRRKPVTYDDLRNVPEHYVAEIIAGELYATPRPAPRHADAGSGLAGVLRGPFDRGREGPGGWRILSEPELHLGEDVLVPDLAGWWRARLPVLPEEAFFSLRPDWICEVLSPRTEALDRGKKLEIYAREGVPHAWLVDPLARTLEALRLETGRWLIAATVTGFDAARVEPFEAIELDLTLLWERPAEVSE